MKNELRLRSIVRVGIEDKKIKARVSEYPKILTGGNIFEWEPIALGHDEMIDLGFTHTPPKESCGCPGFYQKGVFRISDQFLFGTQKINYVHQLQNVMLVWCGEDL